MPAAGRAHYYEASWNTWRAPGHRGQQLITFRAANRRAWQANAHHDHDGGEHGGHDLLLGSHGFGLQMPGVDESLLRGH